ncbi:MAG TPA: penicillin-binding transpeptidase domain-containing protein [Candidatus Margulisiibacteriota bacterium]|nr:penicillin-binding transpeptidase domain-containing protein [Candidatus Margulisiibacteriota bacterium]
MYISNYRRRNEAVFLVFFIFLLACIARLLFIQFFRASYLANIAKKQQSLFVELEPLRGTIYDTNLKPLAFNMPADSVYASPSEMKDKDKEEAVRQLSSILKVGQPYLRERLERKKSFVWIARKILPEQAETIRKLNIRGIGFLKESRRSYPNAYMAAHVIGFAGIDNKGLEGLEAYYDKYLKGDAGWAFFLRDARQNKLDIWDRMVLPKDGYELVLTIDEVIQYIAERELDKAYKSSHAKGACIIVMDPHTGAILAMANRPTFDLNNYTQAEKEEIRNRSVCDLFEPGSVFKIVTASAALEEKRVSEEDKFFCENGSYRVGPHLLHDHQKHGWLTFKGVIEQSSNIGTTKVAQMLGSEVIYRYEKLFGFGTTSGVNLPGEVAGMVKAPRNWSKISIASIPIGQEVGVTSLQLANAISAIANGGQLMRPYIVRQIRDRHGESIKEFSPALIQKTITLETASRVTQILEGVVEEGTGVLAKMEGISAAGKTGTAQKLEPNGTYSHNKFVASFIGFAPVENPMVAIAVTLDEPHPYYGGVVAAPVFKNVASDVIKYLLTKQSLKETLSLNEN